MSEKHDRYAKRNPDIDNFIRTHLIADTPKTPTDAAVAAVVELVTIADESRHSTPGYLRMKFTAALAPYLIVEREQAREVLARNLMAKESYWDDIDEGSRDDVRRRADAILTALTGSATSPAEVAADDDIRVEGELIANDEELSGWEMVLLDIEGILTTSEQYLHHYDSWGMEETKSYYKARIQSATRARDSLLGPIRAYQESREVSDETR